MLQQQAGKTSLINKYMKDPTDIKAAHITSELPIYIVYLTKILYPPTKSNNRNYSQSASVRCPLLHNETNGAFLKQNNGSDL